MGNKNSSLFFITFGVAFLVIMVLFYNLSYTTFFDDFASFVVDIKTRDKLIGYEKGEEVIYYIDQISRNKESEDLNISGWALLPKIESNSVRTKVIFQSSGTYTIYDPQEIKRTDITEHFGNSYNYDDAGFQISVDLSELPFGNYHIGLLLNEGSHTVVKYIDYDVLVGNENIKLKKSRKNVKLEEWNYRMTRSEHEEVFDINTIKRSPDQLLVEGRLMVKDMDAEDSRGWIMLKSDTRYYAFPIPLVEEGEPLLTTTINLKALYEGSYKINFLAANYETYSIQETNEAVRID